MSTQIAKREEIGDGNEVLSLIQKAAIDPNVSVEKMERLFDLQERWEKRKAEKEAHAAMIAARSQMPEVSKDSKGENSKYAKLEKVDRIAYPVYTANGFSLQWSEVPHETPGWTRLKCVVLHNGGHREEHFLGGPMDDKGPKGNANKTGIQGMGSTWSYLQRRLLAMIFNIRIVGDDNDGQAERYQQGPKRPAATSSPPADEAKTLQAKLWELLAPVRGADWASAKRWLVDNKILGPNEMIKQMSVEQLGFVIDKAEIVLEEMK